MRALKKLFVRFCVLLTVTIFILQFTRLVPWAVSRMMGPMDDPDGDILIVLGADAQSDGMIGYVSYGRAMYAARAWRTGHFRAVVVSGGYYPGNNISIAASIARFMIANGVPQDKVFLEERSKSTRENALFTKEMIHSWPGRKVLLTSDLHMFRARRIFEKIGLHVEPRPFPDSTKHWGNPREHLPESVALAIEFVKIGWYWVHGWIQLP